MGIIGNLGNSVGSISAIPATYDVSSCECEWFENEDLEVAVFLGRLGLTVNLTDAMNCQWTRTNNSPFKGKRIAMLFFSSGES